MIAHDRVSERGTRDLDREGGATFRAIPFDGAGKKPAKQDRAGRKDNLSTTSLSHPESVSCQHGHPIDHIATECALSIGDSGQKILRKQTGYRNPHFLLSQPTASQLTQHCPVDVVKRIHA